MSQSNTLAYMFRTYVRSTQHCVQWELAGVLWQGLKCPECESGYARHSRCRPDGMSSDPHRIRTLHPMVQSCYSLSYMWHGVHTAVTRGRSVDCDYSISTRRCMFAKWPDSERTVRKSETDTHGWKKNLLPCSTCRIAGMWTGGDVIPLLLPFIKANHNT